VYDSPMELSLEAQTTYADLLRDHLEFASHPRGSLTWAQRGAAHFLYRQQRIGSSVKQSYIGAEGSADVEHAVAGDARYRAFLSRSEKRVQALKAYGLLAPPRAVGAALSVLERVGAFHAGLVLAGTHAFRLYDGLLGCKVSDGVTVSTQDLDLAAFSHGKLSVASHLASDEAIDLPKLLADAGFSLAPTLNPKGRGYSWIADSGLRLDFLCPSFREDESLMPLEGLRLDGHGLHYLDFLIRDPQPAVILYRSGVLASVPRPERFAIHKLIVGSRRHQRDPVKSKKDLLQAQALITALAAERPLLLEEAYTEALRRGPSWKQHLDHAKARLGKTFWDPDKG